MDREPLAPARRETQGRSLVLAVALLASPAVAAAAHAGVSAGVAGDTATGRGAGSETTGDGKTFENNKKGEFINERSSGGDYFEVQTKQNRIKKGSTKVHNVAVKVNDDGDQVIHDAKTSFLTFNGAPLGMEEGPTFNIPKGGSVKPISNVYEITSEAGDEATITDRGKYAGVEIKAGPNRQGGKLRGSLGQFDSGTDPGNGLVDRDGDVVGNVGAFLEEWRTRLGESMSV